MRTAVLVGALLFTVAASSGCGGSSSPASPTPTTGGGGGNVVTINITGVDGDQSFVPNPAVVPQGSTVVWANTDEQDHRIVATDGSFDTGVIAPGASSGQIVLKTDGANYYCTIHPEMVGSISSSSGFPPPCTGPYCG